MNWLSKTYAFAYRNYIFAKRNFFAFTEILFWPIVGLLSVGIMGDFLNLQENTLAFILTGAITAGVLQVVQLDVSYSLLYDIWSKSIKHTFLAPINQFDYIVGSWVVGMLRGAIVFVLLVLFSANAFAFSMPGVLPTLFFLTGVFLSALIIGMMVCLLILLYGQRVEVTAWSLSTLSMLVSGIYYPVSFLPKPFLLFAYLIPLTHFLEYYRAWYGFPPVFSHSLLTGLALSGLYIAVFFALLRFAFERARRTGMILRLSE
ncbi:MAG: hypothetical protein A2293_00560 [Elusimicrobia bacterium RIFOXYB2_FULL_49_7]|nr:MAG: hypothetical protein A2293_00560 [Elusimicrobia bacterium RIFOXYB2_FULL_49_7]